MHLRVSAVLLALLAGCSSTPDSGELEAPLARTSCELTVIVWSEHLQRPVAGEGVVASVGGDFETSLNTRESPDKGQTISGLQPGRYRVRVTARYLPNSGKKAVNGEQVIYLEPGARQQITIVAVDRKGDLGLLDEDTLPASTPHLPLERKRG